MAVSATLSEAILDAMFIDGNVVAAMFLSLHTGDPGTTGASEVSTGSYARVELKLDGTTTPHMAAPGTGTIANADVLAFPEGGGDASVSHVGASSASTAGDFYCGGALDSSFTYTATTTPQFGIGALEFEVT